MLSEAHDIEHLSSGVYHSTVGLVFFGTPFRGTNEVAHHMLLSLAEQALSSDQVYDRALRASQREDESLIGILDRYLVMSDGAKRPRIACVIEQKPTNLAVMFGEVCSCDRCIVLILTLDSKDRRKSSG